MTAKVLLPKDEPKLLKQHQSALLTMAESLLGPRDSAWTILSPQFEPNGPRLRHDLYKRRTVWVELSNGASGYWPTAVFELSHEVVHLLNPVENYTNYLEEGIAVAFQRRMASALGILMPIKGRVYLEAESLVRHLDSNPIETGRRLREFGKLSEITEGQIKKLFPNTSRETAAKLASECIPR